MGMSNYLAFQTYTAVRTPSRIVVADRVRVSRTVRDTLCFLQKNQYKNYHQIHVVYIRFNTSCDSRIIGYGKMKKMGPCLGCTTDPTSFLHQYTS